MSDGEHQGTDILLPQAQIAVFSDDEETLTSAQALENDWRFARVSIECMEGDVDTAIGTYEYQESPDLIIIQTDDINDEFTERLGELSGHCEEGTAAIVVGPVNDVYLYRTLIEMGVTDYLVRPLKPEIISEVVSKALIERLGVSDSRLIAFIGGKGGVGTSTIAEIASLVASEKMEQKTTLLDIAGGWSDLGVGIGFDPAATLHEIARAVEAENNDALDRMFHEATERLSVLASGADSMLDPSVTPEQCEEILDHLMVKSPVVTADLSSAESSVKKAVLARAHHIVLVTTPTVTSLRFARALLKEIGEVRGGDLDDVSLIVNKVGAAKAHEISAGDIETALEFKPSASINFDPSLFLKYESEILTLVSDKGDDTAVTAILPILQKTIDADIQIDDTKSGQATGGIKGLLGKLKSK